MGASLAQLAVALFLILAVLGQSATDALPIRDHIEESGTLKSGVTISVVRESDDRTLFSVWSVCAAPSRNAEAGAEPKAGGGGTVLGFFLWDA